ncbi:MAG TPA: hypothetical protein VMB85_21990 [Bryobacteraceae bacterium]|jgi:hypothetical protein|nr:hypothetical protein [Bryobacteraceae bacterium]
MNLKFVGAMACYAGLALLAGLTLDGKFRIGTWIILGYFAIRTYLVVLKDRLD